MKQRALPALGLIAMLGLAACSGFDFERLVRVNVPLGIQQDEGLPARISLADSKQEFAAWAEDVKREAALWRAANQRGAEVVGVLRSVTQSALDTYGPAIGGLPVGPVGSVALAGILGLLFKRPGDTTADQLSKEKQDSYNAGLKKGAEASREAANA